MVVCLARNTVISLLFIFGLVGSASGKPFAEHYQDLSHVFNNRTIYAPFPQKQQWTLDITEYKAGEDMRFAGGNFMAGEHGGTHIDAPYHIDLDHGWTLEKIPLDMLRAPAVVLDVKEDAKVNSDYQASVADILEWEERHGRMPDDSIVLICTDWDKKWPNKETYFGSSNVSDLSTFHFPAVHPDLAEWLVKYRTVVGIGIDTLSPDNLLSLTVANNVHRIIATRNLIILENLRAVCEIPQGGATLLMIPMLVEGGTGGPVRVIATWGDDAIAGTSGNPTIQGWAMLSILFCGKLILIIAQILPI